jgi:hypothetical protein
VCSIILETLQRISNENFLIAMLSLLYVPMFLVI